MALPHAPAHNSNKTIKRTGDVHEAGVGRARDVAQAEALQARQVGERGQAGVGDL